MVSYSIPAMAQVVAESSGSSDAFVRLRNRGYLSVRALLSRARVVELIRETWDAFPTNPAPWPRAVSRRRCRARWCRVPQYPRLHMGWSAETPARFCVTVEELTVGGVCAREATHTATPRVSGAAVSLDGHLLVGLGSAEEVRVMPRERRKTTDTATTGTSSAPSHEDVARRAHEIWRARGSESGHELDHWLEAEQELAAGQSQRRRRADARERSATT